MNDELAGIYGGTDSGNGLTRYPYRIGNTYTWVEAFIPFPLPQDNGSNLIMNLLTMLKLRLLTLETLH